MIQEIILNDHLSFKTKLHEKLKQLIDIKLAEMRFDIIQKEFGFLNERIVSNTSKSKTNPTKNFNQHVSLAKTFQTQKINKDPTTTTKKTTTSPIGYKKIGGQLVRMSSLEKFNRRTAISKRKFKATNHIQVAVRKRGQVLQKNKILGVNVHQKSAVLGTKKHG